ncbi:MAG: hypothetical protein HGA44_15315, partial [Cellulomonadaceae bacterium]|nr:hypothetical protein [Cellulomonadaceae bacterium]
MRAAADPELLTGYTPHLSYLPGEAVDVHLSAPEPVTGRLVRLTGPAAADGVPTEPVVGTPAFEVTAPGVHRLPTGSWARVRIAEPVSCDVGFWLLPTHRRPTRRTVVALRRGAAHVSLGTDADGALEVRAGVDGDSDGTAGAVPIDLALARMRWQQVEVRVEPEEVVVVLTVRSQRREVRVPLATALGGALGPLEVTFAASADAQPSGFFDGKVDRPVVGGVEIRTEPDQLGDALRDPEGVVVGRLVNHPTRGVTGHTWRDQTGRWTDDPSLYTAVHFHSDDLDDAGWPVAATLTLPADLTSGLYAVEARSGAQRDWLPFAVRAATPAAVTVLLPTFTYLAYANEAPFAPHVPVREDSRDTYATRHALTSLYSYHDDGSGVAYASLRRPLLNLRPDYRYWLTGYPHGPGADLAILAFLDHLGVDYDVVTDHDLDADPTLLDGRRALVTGCHPEYWSRRMMAALEGWLDASGRLLYFGGNGLYAMVATLPDAPHLLELRRRGAEVGLWEAEP